MSEFFIPALGAQLDYLVFAALLLGLFAFLQRRFWRGWRLAGWRWLLPLALLGAGWFAVEAAGRRERARMQQMVEGYAPTYARELERLGHESITLSTAPGDPLYGQMLEAQKRWLAANPSVNDIYTMRRLPDGRTVLVVDSETDYDRDGRFEGEREQRTAIGEVYEEVFAALERAYATGEASFEEDIVSDRWGNWVSAVVPMRDQNGRIDAVLGVDFDAAAWLAAIRRARLTALGYLAALGLIAAGLSGAAAHRIAVRDLAALRREQEALVESSRKAGMAEVATGVLHNVGNVLNSVTVSSSVIAERLRASKAGRLAEVAALLQEQNGSLAEFLTTDPRGRLVPELLARLAVTLREEQSAIRDEAAALVKSVAHIRDIVALQQSFATVSACAERIEPAALVEDALRMTAASRTRHEVEIVRDFAAMPATLTDRHKTLQILVNLIRNAEQSMDAHGSASKVLTLTIAPGGEGRVRIAVRDNGGGILAENLPRLFGHGFTTKKDGHGFGLHSSASAARELGGALRVESDGPGTGAVFTLELPHSITTQTAAA